MKTMFATWLAVGAFASAAPAANYHVAAGGNDTSPGTPAAPLRTIQQAANLAQPGDVMHGA